MTRGLREWVAVFDPATAPDPHALARAPERLAGSAHGVRSSASLLTSATAPTVRHTHRAQPPSRPGRSRRSRARASRTGQAQPGTSELKGIIPIAKDRTVWLGCRDSRSG